MATLKEKEQEKIQYGLLLLKTQDRLSTKFIKLIKDGLYELRAEYGGNIFRVLASPSSFAPRQSSSELDIALGLVSVLHIRRRKNCRFIQWLSEEEPENAIKRNRKSIKDKGGILCRQTIIK